MASFDPTLSDIKDCRITVRPSGRLNRRSYGYINRTKENQYRYPQMHHGFNCTKGYDPTIHKFCSKCGLSDHHEFECKQYIIINHFTCMLCPTLHHLTRECSVIIKKLGHRLHNDDSAVFTALLIILETSYNISALLLANAQACDTFCSTKKKDILQTTSREKSPKYILYKDILFRSFHSKNLKAMKFPLCIPTSLMWPITTIIRAHLKTQSKSKILKSFMDSFFHPMAKEAVNQFYKHYGL
jgi:hypothetical protein